MRKLIAVCGAMLAFSAVADPVAFVNVGGAIDDAVFGPIVSNKVRAVGMVNAEVEKAQAINVGELANRASKGYPKEARKIGVYFIDTTDLPPQLTCPGHFAVINVRGLRKDADEKTYKSRITKMALKGLAVACGFGANQDVGRCVMSMGSFDTLKGIDSTSESYSPFCFFPLSDYLQTRNLNLVPTK